MRLRENYDWIVIGNHPGALLSAALAGRLGLSVLVVPLSPFLNFFHSASGQYFDPESNYILGLTHSEQGEGLTHMCLNHLGALAAVQKQVALCTSQVLTPHCRLSLSISEGLQTEFEREFGNSPLMQKLGLIAALEATQSRFLTFWNELPKKLTLNLNRRPHSQDPISLLDLRRNFEKKFPTQDPAVLAWLSSKSKVSDLMPSSEAAELKEACLGFWSAISSSGNPNPTPFDLLHLLNLSRTGASFRGGMTAYREFLKTLASQWGVHIAAQEECRRLFVEKGRFVGVQVARQGNMISAVGGIIGCSLDQALNQVTYTGKSWIYGKKTPTDPIGWKFSIALTVHTEAIPIGMKSRAIWQEKGAPALEIEIIHPSDYGDSTDCRVIYVRTLLPFTQQSLESEFQVRVASRMLRQLMEIIPFLEFHVIRIYPNFKDNTGGQSIFGGGSELNHPVLGQIPVQPIASTLAEGRTPTGVNPLARSSELSELYSFSSVGQIPDNLKVYAGEGLGSSTGIDGLFLASDESYPLLGSLGGTVAALEAVAWLAHRSGFAGPFTTG